MVARRITSEIRNVCQAILVRLDGLNVCVMAKLTNIVVYKQNFICFFKQVFVRLAGLKVRNSIRPLAPVQTLAEDVRCVLIFINYVMNMNCGFQKIVFSLPEV